MLPCGAAFSGYLRSNAGETGATFGTSTQQASRRIWGKWRSAARNSVPR